MEELLYEVCSEGVPIYRRVPARKEAEYYSRSEADRSSIEYQHLEKYVQGEESVSRFMFLDLC